MQQPELIVKMKPEIELRVTASKLSSKSSAQADSLSSLLKSEKGILKPLFSSPRDERTLGSMRFDESSAVTSRSPETYFSVEAAPERFESLSDELMNLDSVEAAYIKPPAEDAGYLNVIGSDIDEISVATPDYTKFQGYLKPAPHGIDAEYAWRMEGGRGKGVKIIDIERGWNFTHEDLLGNQGGVVNKIIIDDKAWRNHGTAAVGIFSADENSFGITGICCDANVRAFAIIQYYSANAILRAADMLDPGDIILIEIHRPGPRFAFQERDRQEGYIPIEWWPDEFEALKAATDKGIIVVAAAGNGSENLDDAIYNERPRNFPPSWVNPFDRTKADSGSILVGAGAPPDQGSDRPDRSRLEFSNYGSAVDVQGWGMNVATTGYGDLQRPPDEDSWYTDKFRGTSSAAPIVVGAVGCLQGVLTALGKPRLGPLEMRDLLRRTGSPQENAPGRPVEQRIGNRPNLKEMILESLGEPPDDEEEQTRRIELFGLPLYLLVLGILAILVILSLFL